MSNEVNNKKANFDNKEEVENEVTQDQAVLKPVSNRVLVLISDGARFDPDTGKELTKKFYQSFTRNEWEQFERNAKSLGMKYEIIYMPKWK